MLTPSSRFSNHFNAALDTPSPPENAPRDPTPSELRTFRADEARRFAREASARQQPEADRQPSQSQMTSSPEDM